MKFLYLLLLLMSFSISCKSSKEKGVKLNLKSVEPNCPNDGVCTFDVLKNKSLTIEKDDIGTLYPIVLEGKTTVLKFEYKRNEIPNTQDGHYNELIYVEIPQDIKTIEVSNKGLAKYKVLFARLCFCRGQSGYYNVSKGNMSINEVKKGEYNLQLDFEIDEVPQIITSMNETFSLNKKKLN